MRILWLLSIALATIPAQAQASNTECPPYSEPRINITRIYDQPRYDTSLDVNAIYNMARNIQYKSRASNELPVGLTSSLQQLNTSFEISAQTLPNGAVCAQITTLEMRYGFAETTVYIANELEEGSCGFQEVLAHEHKHVATDIDVMEQTLPQLNILASGILNHLGAIKVSSVEEANNYYSNALNRQMDELSASFSATHDAQQSQVDTPEEYKRISTSCNNEISRIASQTLKP